MSKMTRETLPKRKLSEATAKGVSRSTTGHELVVGYKLARWSWDCCTVTGSEVATETATEARTRRKGTEREEKEVM